MNHDALCDERKRHVVAQPLAAERWVSPLRVDLMGATTRQCLHDYLQERLTSYHEDENGNPAPSPGHARETSPTAMPASVASGASCRPARGLVTLRCTPDAPEHSGIKVLCALSGTGNLTLQGGPDFETELFSATMSKLVVNVSDDAAHSRVFALSCVGAEGEACPHVPRVFCFVRDEAARDKWVGIFRRRNVTIGALAAVLRPSP